MIIFFSSVYVCGLKCLNRMFSEIKSYSIIHLFPGLYNYILCEVSLDDYIYDGHCPVNPELGFNSLKSLFLCNPHFNTALKIF